jgi:hypothetical protein
VFDLQRSCETQAVSNEAAVHVEFMPTRQFQKSIACMHIRLIHMGMVHDTYKQDYHDDSLLKVLDFRQQHDLQGLTERT